MLEHLSDWLTYGGLFVFVIGMAWNDGVDRATNYIITATNWNDLIGASGSLMQLKAHAHGGTTGEGSQSLGPLVKATFTDAAAPAAPAAGQTSIYTVSGKPRYRANGGADRAIVSDETTAAGDLAGTYPSPTVSKITVGGDANGDTYYRAAGVLARLGIGTPLQVYRTNGAGTAPEWATFGTITVLDKDVATTTIVSSAAEADLYRKTITGNTIGATGGLRLMVSGDAINNTGGGATLTFRIKFGATTIFTTAALAIGNSPSRHKWKIDITLLQSATNAQRFTGTLVLGAAGGGIDATTSAANGMDYTTSAEDTTANKDIAITGQLSASSPVCDVRQQMALLEAIA